MRSIQTAIILGAAVLLSLLLSACGGSTNTTTAPTASVFSSMGTDFYLTIPDHLCVSTPASCNNVAVSNKLIIAAATSTTGEITFNGVITPYAVAAGGQTVVSLAPTTVITSNELIEARGIHVTAQSPVSVHVVSESATSAEGYLALPTAALGNNYYVMSYASARYAGSEFAVVATQDNTIINITPTASGATRVAGTPFTLTLNTGETYQLANPAGADMTGSLVSADKPVAVFGGHRCAEVPSNVGYCDYIVEQIPDVSLWGSTYHTVPFSGRARYTVRVLASQNGTTFTSAPAGMPATLDAGQYADVTLTAASEIISNNPVLVAQFIRSYADDTAGKGDPSMVLVTPTAVNANEMGVTDSTFGVHGLAGTASAFMNLVVQTADLANLKLDNVMVQPSLFMPLSPTSSYSYATIPVAPGTHTLSGATPYSALVYDFGIASNSVSYAYPVGATLTRPLPVTAAPAPTPTPASPVPTVTQPQSPASPPPPVCAGTPNHNHTIDESTQHHGDGDHNDDGHADNGLIAGDHNDGDHNDDGNDDNGYGNHVDGCDWE